MFYPQEPSTSLIHQVLSLIWFPLIRLGQLANKSTRPPFCISPVRGHKHMTTCQHCLIGSWIHVLMLNGCSPWSLCIALSSLSKNEMFFQVTIANCIFYSLLNGLSHISPFLYSLYLHIPYFMPIIMHNIVSTLKIRLWTMTLIILQNSTIFHLS